MHNFPEDMPSRPTEASEKAGAQIREQWDTFDTVLSHIPSFAYTFDLEGRFTYINRALLDLWQLSFEQAVGKNFFELQYPPELAARLQRQIQEVIDTKSFVRDHTPFTGPTGETRYYEYMFAPVFGGNGQVRGVAGSTHDITERKQMEQAVLASEERLQQVLEQAPVAIVVLRAPDFRIELANPPYQMLLQNRKLLGRRFDEVVPELGQDVWDAFRRVIETGEPFVRNEFHIPYDQDGDGQVEDHWFNVMYHPLRDANESISGLVAVCNDVTAQVLARRELERANRELEEFAYVASHDLQEPLRMVQSYTQLLLRRHVGDNPQAQQYAAFIHSGVCRMEDLIQDLLTFSRTVHSELTYEGADLTAALGDAILVLRSRIDDTGAIITSGDLPAVRGDTTQLSQLFQNLLSNALKYRDPQTRPQVHITAQRTGNQWTVTVRDNGIGFEPQYAERIFGLFKRLHKNEFPGTGLGLAICQRIIERHGGKIWAESSLGHGAAFHFTLPAFEPAGQQSPT